MLFSQTNEILNDDIQNDNIELLNALGKYVELIENHLVKIQDDGSIELNMHYFHFHRS